MNEIRIFAKIHDSECLIPYTSFVFSGGEVHVRLENITEIPLASEVTITAYIRSSDDLLELLLITDAIRKLNNKADINLVMPYAPYARQDRVMVSGESFSLKVFSSIINAQHYDSVTIWDSHSDVATALIDKCINIPQQELLKQSDPFGKNIVLVSPDAGAEKKILKFGKWIKKTDIVFASKIRDVVSGNIIETKVDIPEKFIDRDFLIVDDICDGGRTFIELANAIRKKGVMGKIKLLVTHGIFSKGIEVFDGVIDEIFVINNINNALSTAETKVTNL